MPIQCVGRRSCGSLHPAGSFPGRWRNWGIPLWPKLILECDARRQFAARIIGDARGRSVRSPCDLPSAGCSRPGVSQNSSQIRDYAEALSEGRIVTEAETISQRIVNIRGKFDSICRHLVRIRTEVLESCMRPGAARRAAIELARLSRRELPGSELVPSEGLEPPTF